jgi:tRNA 2-thiouridine synthesizing protein B
MMLHTVNKSPFERDTLDACLGHALPGSVILFIEDGIYAALEGTVHSAKIAKAAKDKKIYVLAPDLAARGMGGAKLVDGVEAVDYARFVDLACECRATQAWL